MIDKAYFITDEIQNSNINEKLIKIKNKIINDPDLKKIIDNFKNAKELYEKYKIKDDFIEAKKKLLENEILKEYVDIQNKINMLSIKINNRIKQITDGVTNKK